MTTRKTRRRYIPRRKNDEMLSYSERRLLDRLRMRKYVSFSSDSNRFWKRYQTTKI